MTKNNIIFHNFVDNSQMLWVYNRGKKKNKDNLFHTRPKYLLGRLFV